MPRPPALETVAQRRGVEVCAMPARRIGWGILRRVVRGVVRGVEEGGGGGEGIVVVEGGELMRVWVGRRLGGLRECVW